MASLDFAALEYAPPAKWPILGDKSDRSELQIQFAFRKVAGVICPRVRIVAVPNGTHIASNAGRRKADMEGRSTGFPDVMCIWANGTTPSKAVPGTAYIEFKAGTGGSVSEAQREWLDWLRANGFPCVVSRHEAHALDFLRAAGAPFRDRVGL